MKEKNLMRENLIKFLRNLGFEKISREDNNTFIFYQHKENYLGAIIDENDFKMISSNPLEIIIKTIRICDINLNKIYRFLVKEKKYQFDIEYEENLYISSTDLTGTSRGQKTPVRPNPDNIIDKKTPYFKLKFFNNNE